MKAVRNSQSTYGDIAQLVERCVRNAEVRGSSPLISTKLRKVANKATFSLFFPIFVGNLTLNFLYKCEKHSKNNTFFQVLGISWTRKWTRNGHEKKRGTTAPLF